MLVSYQHNTASAAAAAAAAASCRVEQCCSWNKLTANMRADWYSEQQLAEHRSVAHAYANMHAQIVGETSQIETLIAGIHARGLQL